MRVRRGPLAGRRTGTATIVWSARGRAGEAAVGRHIAGRGEELTARGGLARPGLNGYALTALGWRRVLRAQRLGNSCALRRPVRDADALLEAPARPAVVSSLEQVLCRYALGGTGIRGRVFGSVQWARSWLVSRSHRQTRPAVLVGARLDRAHNRRWRPGDRPAARVLESPPNALTSPESAL